MNNVADLIEQFILQKLAGEKGQIIVLRRNELADELACAPSQISYVLSTRFTMQRGFVVESRRGLGGFVRISRQEAPKNQDRAELTRPPTEKETANWIVGLRRQGIISPQEEKLLRFTAALILRRCREEERIPLMKELTNIMTEGRRG